MYGDNLDDVKYLREKCDTDCSENNTKKAMYLNNISEQDEIHVVVYENKLPIGCGSMTIIENTFWFTDINVIKEQRRKKVGDFILRLLIEKADLMNAKEIYIACTDNNKIFFQNFGFAPCVYPLKDIRNTIENKANNLHWMCLNLSKYRMHHCCNK